MDEHLDTAATTDAPERHDYADFGERVAGILNAAETAAAEIRSEAERVAEELRRRAADEAEAYAGTRRSEADAEADRLVAQASADAAAVRDAVYAAAQRISDEGTRTLEALRTEARALENRFETAVDDLRGLIGQLENVVLDAGSRAHEPEPVGAWDEPAPAEQDEAEPPGLDEELGARLSRDQSLS
jgi:seryl-tRNA synthetase